MKSSATLNKSTILVTRPAHQATSLMNLIENAGGVPIHFPTIEISPPEDEGPLFQALSVINEADIVIFTSVNAIHRSLDVIEKRGISFAFHTKLAVIGDASAATLKARWRAADIVPKDSFSSETLLNHPELIAVHDKKIIIFTGERGRELLKDTLTARGALVWEASAYRRVVPKAMDKEVQRKLSNGLIDIIVTASGESLENLHTLLGDEEKQQLLNTPLLVVSERVAQIAQQLGYTTQALVAKEVSDQGILSTLIEAKKANNF